MKEFSAKELPIDAPTTVRQMLEQYQVPTLSLKGIFMYKTERARVDPCDIRLDNWVVMILDCMMRIGERRGHVFEALFNARQVLQELTFVHFM